MLFMSVRIVARGRVLAGPGERTQGGLERVASRGPRERRGSVPREEFSKRGTTAWIARGAARLASPTTQAVHLPTRARKGPLCFGRGKVVIAGLVCGGGRYFIAKDLLPYLREPRIHSSQLVNDSAG